MKVDRRYSRHYLYHLRKIGSVAIFKVRLVECDIYEQSSTVYSTIKSLLIDFKWISNNLNNYTKMGDMGPIEYFICGGFGGICTVLVGHPLDTIKVSIL